MSSVLVACVVLVSAMAGESPAPAVDVRKAYEEARALAGRDANAQVRLALWCEEHGLQAERVKHLAVAVLTNPSHAAARGLLGLVEYRGKWSKPESVASQVKSDRELAEALAEYNARRTKVRDRADDHYALAAWCEEHGLKPESVAHFTAVTRLDPSREAAWKHLGFKKRNGQWASEAQLAAHDLEAEAQRKANQRWKPLLEKYKSWLGEKARRADAEAKLREVTDPRAVAAIVSAFGATPAGQRVAVGLLGQVDGPAAAKALAVLAVRGGSSEVRRVAAETLRKRDPRDFLDLLVDAVRKPARYEVRPVGGPGSPGVLVVEGETYNVRRFYAPPDRAAVRVPNRLFADDVPFDPQASQVAEMFEGLTPNNQAAARGRNSAQNDPNALVAQSTQTALARDARVARAIQRNLETAAQEAAIAQQALANDVRLVEAMNEQIRTANDRVVPILKELTDKDYGDDQPAWRRWWTDQKGYALMATDNTVTIKPTFDVFVPLPTVPSRYEHHSCFAGGTPVKTIDGPRSIETLRLGDRLVVQDTKTGALGYQPVVAVYHNPPNRTFRVKLEGETIVATGIHRFWKAGKGWAMARDLKPGDTLRTLGGSAKVVAVDPDKVQPVFNLEVAAGRSFFVGESGALVHDNSLVEATPEPFDAPRLASAASK